MLLLILMYKSQHSVKVDSDPVILDTWNGRFKLIALKTLEFGLCRSDSPVPVQKGLLLIWFDPCRNDRRDGRGRFTRFTRCEEMDLTLTNQKWVNLAKQVLSL
jgi:hypothetical protein